MALMQWNLALSIKVKKFDDQHLELLALVNRLHDGMRAGQGSTLLGNILQELISNADRHFCDEELLMQTSGFPDFAAHKAEHEKLVKQVLDLQKKYQAGSAVLTITVMQFLEEWLANHILQMDKKYGEFLNDRGIS